MKRDIYFEIDGRRADLMPDMEVTLNYNSSLLSDITNIKSNVSQTITLPRTANNDAIFDLAAQPQYNSGKRGVKLLCRMYIDGITIFNNGQCHLLDSGGDEYEIAVTFGIMQEYGEWINAKKKLTELTKYEEDSVVWNDTWGVEIKKGGVSKIEYKENEASMYAMMYFCGVDIILNNRRLCNIHPCVTLQEIWERIRRENDLKFNLGSVFADLNNYAIVLKNNNKTLQTIEENLKIEERPFFIEEGNEIVKKIYLDIKNEDFFNPQTSSFLYYGYKQAKVYIEDIYLTFSRDEAVGLGYDDFKEEILSDPENNSMIIKLENEDFIIYPSDTLYDDTVLYRINRTFIIDDLQGDDDSGKEIISIIINIKKPYKIPDVIWYYPNHIAGGQGVDYGGWEKPFIDAVRLSRGNNGILTTNVIYTYENNSNDYPLASFTLVDNLPDISQIDFVKFICHFYGLFPVKNGDAIDFIKTDVLRDNIDRGQIVDWSGKLAVTNEDAPQTIAFSLDGYAQRNIVQYKEDKNDPIDIAASLNVEDMTLDRERIMIEFPFSASLGNRIPQYSYDEDGGIEKKDYEYRLMRVKWENNLLTFANSMKPQQIVNLHYQTLQDFIRKPIVIEEEIMLNELDLAGLDYTKPVYLSKYGRYYAVISIQWKSDEMTSKVKLLQIR